MSETIPPEFWQGVELFNTGQFYACHDTLEALWMESTEPDKSFYQGILQISVALYHLGNGNLKGAIILLGEGSNRLARYPSIYSQVDVDQLLEQSIALLKALQQKQLEQNDSSSFEADTLPLPRVVRVEE
ncbi:MAG: DUF309 domain-containing protein [Rivularia sp. (in: cyanobacteria)]